MEGRRERPQRPATDDERREYLNELEASGLSVAAFARGTGLSPFTVYGWRRRLQRSEAVSPLGDFFEVEVTQDAERAAVVCGSYVAEVVIADVALRVPAGFDGAELARLLDVLRSRC